MPEPGNDPSVFEEPHHRPEKGHPRGPRYAKEGDHSVFDERVFQDAPEKTPKERDERFWEGSVWEEPAISTEPSIQAPKGSTWKDWFERRLAETTTWESWRTFLIVAVLGGPFAILGSLLSALMGWYGILSLVLVGPAVEEILKVAAATYVVERRTYLFRHGFQVLLAAAASGFAFAVIENLTYLHVYVEVPSPRLIAWRWTVCTTLHVGTSLIAGLGVLRSWRKAHVERIRPELSQGLPLLITAVVLHGLYNAFAMIVEFAIEPF